MKFSLKKELPILSIIAIPFLYLAYLWNSLPEKVPIHWNIKGEIDGWGTKDQLILIVLALPVLIYGIFLLVPLIDPKKKLDKMGNKFYQLKFLMVLFMSVLAVFILYNVQHQSLSNMKMLYVLIGFLFVALGNYFQTLKPNYFIGIKTPWTLENETVWKETHKLGGKLWFFGGILMILAVLLLPIETSFVVFIAATSIFAIVPIVYSYTKYKALEN
jgi:uncharacterized membrane protein